MDAQFAADTSHRAYDARFASDRARRTTEVRREATPVAGQAATQAECGSGWYHDAAITRARADARHA